jgi:hypothetical protein
MTTPPTFVATNVLTAAQMNKIGLWLIDSKSVTAGASITFTGCFSANYSQYKIFFRNTAKSDTGDDNLKLTLGSSATNYRNVVITSDGTTVSTNSLVTTYMNIALISYLNQDTFASIDLSYPYESQPTLAVSQATQDTGSAIKSYWSSHQQTDSTSFSDCTLAISAGTITAEAWIYGYRMG